MTGPALDGPPILFVDLDDTVRHGPEHLPTTAGGAVRYVNTPDDVVVFPEAVARMGEWHDAGGVVVGVTNQAGVAYGYMTEATHLEVVRATLGRCLGTLDHVIACEHHPAAGCWCRKPLPGLLLHALNWASARPGVTSLPDRSACLMVGDRPEDAGAARAAGVPFLHALDWRAGGVAWQQHLPLPRE